MKKNLTEIVFILDRSGSMGGLEEDTIGGFNAMLEKQRSEPGEAIVSTVLFDNESQVVHDRVDIRQVAPLTRETYYVRGCTALLDAVGGAIHHISNVHKYARKEDVPEKTMFIITTDGYENASRRYDYDKVRKMIERQKEQYGWEFLFLGANIDAAAEANGGTEGQRLGVARLGTEAVVPLIVQQTATHVVDKHRLIMGDALRSQKQPHMLPPAVAVLIVHQFLHRTHQVLRHRHHIRISTAVPLFLSLLPLSAGIHETESRIFGIGEILDSEIFFSLCDTCKSVAVLNEVLPAVLLTEVAELFIGADTLTVAEMVGNIKHNSEVTKRCGKFFVSFKVLCHTVSDLDNSLYVTVFGLIGSRVDFRKT